MLQAEEEKENKKEKSEESNFVSIIHRLLMCLTILAGVFSQITIIIVIIYFNCKWVFTRWQWYYNKAQHTNNTHHTK
jgi:hypothetical protein